MAEALKSVQAPTAERDSIVGSLERDPHGRGGSLFYGSLRMGGGNSKNSMALWFPEAEERLRETCGFFCTFLPGEANWSLDSLLAGDSQRKSQ